MNLELNQQATYWAPGVPDGAGGYSFAAVAAVLVSVRWQDVQQLFRDTEGREVVSSAVVYLDQPLAVRGYLALGDAGAGAGSDPRDVVGSREVRQIGRSPSLLADEVLYKVFL